MGIFAFATAPPAPVFAQAQAAPPGAPTGLSAVAVSDTVVELYWTAPSNTGGAPITDYRVESRADTAGSTWAVINVSTVSDDTHQEHTVSGTDTLYYRVSAVSQVGAGVASNVASTTPTPTPAAANQPQSVVARANGAAEINLTWTKVSGAAQYIIEYTEEIGDTGASDLPWMEVATVGNVDEYSDTSLDPVTTRHYRVSAVTNSVRGPASSTPDVADPTLLSPDSHAAQDHAGRGAGRADGAEDGCGVGYGG